MMPDVNGNGAEKRASAEQLLSEIGVNDLPKSVFACDVPSVVFDEDDAKEEFEKLFANFTPTNFTYLQNFRRVRVYFESPMDAAQARIALHEYEFKNQVLKIFFAQVQPTVEATSDSLLPPQPERLFLISPPASPPVGWEPIPESEPVIDYNLLSAIATLEPGGSHEIHPGTQRTPSVVVHTCAEMESGTQPKLKIQQTRRPGPTS